MNTFDPNLNVAFALCRAAYDPSLMATARPFYHDWGDVAGVIALDASDSFIWRAWMGTHCIWDWLEDARAIPNSAGQHTGVANHYASALKSMTHVLGEFPAGLPIRDTGHSLGGAMAELAWAATVNVLPPITFEAMRVFTLPRVRWLPKSGIRIVNEWDIVPHLPGRCGLWNYEHRSPALRFNGGSLLPIAAHSLEISVGPALLAALSGDCALEGPLDID